MKKKRFLSWVLIFTMLFSLTAGMQKAEATSAYPPASNKLKVFETEVTATSGTGLYTGVGAPIDPYVITVNVGNSVTKIATGDIVAVSSVPGPPMMSMLFKKEPFTPDNIVRTEVPLSVGTNNLYVLTPSLSGLASYKVIIKRATGAEAYITDKKITDIGFGNATLNYMTSGPCNTLYYKLVEEGAAVPERYYTVSVGDSIDGIADKWQSLNLNYNTTLKPGKNYTCYFFTSTELGTSEEESISFTTLDIPASCKIVSVASVRDFTISYRGMNREQHAPMMTYNVKVPSNYATISPKDIQAPPGATIEMYEYNAPMFSSGPARRMPAGEGYVSVKTPITDGAPMALYTGSNAVMAKVTNGLESVIYYIYILRSADPNSAPLIPNEVKLLSVAGCADGVLTAVEKTEGEHSYIQFEYRMDSPNTLSQIVPSDILIPEGARADVYYDGEDAHFEITPSKPLVLVNGENIFYVDVMSGFSKMKAESIDGIPVVPEKSYSALYKIILNRSAYSNKLTIKTGTGGSVTTGKTGYYATGDVVTVVATANSGYKFNGWSTNHGGAFGSVSNASTTFTVPEGNVDITASFVVNTTGGTTGGGGNDRPSAGGTSGGGVISGGGSTGGTTGGTTGGGTAGGGTAPSGKTEPGTPGNTGDAAKKLNDLMGKLGDKAQQGAVVDDAAKLLGDLSKATEEVKTNEGAVQAAGNVRDAINNASKIVKEVDAAGADAKIVERVKDVLEASAQALDKITDDKAKLKATGDIIAEGSKFLKNAGTARDTSALKQKIVDMARRAVEEASTSELKPTVTGGTVKAKITAEVAVELLKSAEKNAQAISELNKNLAEGGITEALEKTVTLDLGTNPDMKKLSAEMSGKVLSDLSKAGVKNLEIVSGESSLKIKSDSVPTGTKSFSVEVKSVDMTQKGLTKLQKKFIETHTVIDINASITNAKGKTSNVTSLKSKVEVEIPYTLKEGQDPTKVEVYVKLDNGTFKKYIGTYNGETKTAIVGMDKF